jgi:Spy/CpxP family protein refolding chaperone
MEGTKQLIALVIGIAFAIFFCGLFLLGKYDYKGLALLLGVAALIGLGVANYDNFSTVEAWGLKWQAKQIQDETIQEIRKEVASQRASLSDDMKKVNEALEKSQRLLAELQTESQFYSTVLAAQADDRHAFDQLKSWSEDQNNPFAKRAQAAWGAIFKAHNEPLYFGGFAIPWAPGVDPSKFTLDDLKSTYSKAPTEVKPALIEYIAIKRIDIPLHDRGQFLIDVMHGDSSLSAVEYAGRFFCQINNLGQKSPLALDYYSQWWNDNKDHIH